MAIRSRIFPPPIPSYMIVSANTGKGQTLFLVDANAAGISRHRLTMLDTRNAARIAQGLFETTIDYLKQRGRTRPRRSPHCSPPPSLRLTDLPRSPIVGTWSRIAHKSSYAREGGGVHGNTFGVPSSRGPNSS